MNLLAGIEPDGGEPVGVDQQLAVRLGEVGRLLDAKDENVADVLVELLPVVILSRVWHPLWHSR